MLGVIGLLWLTQAMAAAAAAGDEEPPAEDMSRAKYKNVPDTGHLPMSRIEAQTRLNKSPGIRWCRLQCKA